MKYKLNVWEYLEEFYGFIHSLLSDMHQRVLRDPKTRSVSLNEDLSKVSRRAYLWKALLSLEMSKQAPEINLSCKKSVINHRSIYFNNMLTVTGNI